MGSRLPWEQDITGFDSQISDCCPRSVPARVALLPVGALQHPKLAFQISLMDFGTVFFADR